MSKDEVQVKRVLVSLLKNAYENYLDYSKFHLYVVPKELSTKHGHYKPREAKIEVFNLTRPPKHTLITCIHEVAHHVETVDYGVSGHQESFYEIFHHLLKTAFGMKLLEMEDLLSLNDTHDLSGLTTYYGEPETWEIPTIEIDETAIIIVSKAYDDRLFLKNNGYVWFSTSQVWQKECKNEEVLGEELSFLKEHLTTASVKVQKNQELSFFSYYYLAVLDDYDYRKKLRERGYMWESYGREKEWVKKVEASSYYEEIKSLGDLDGIHYKKVTPDYRRMEAQKKRTQVSAAAIKKTTRRRITFI